MILHTLLHFLLIIIEWYIGTLLLLIPVVIISEVLKIQDDVVKHYTSSIMIYTIVFIIWRVL